jgi:hypothetical protein
MAKPATKPPAPDAREAFLQRNVSPWQMQLSPAALDDVRYFAKRAAEGRPLTIRAFERWLNEKHQLKIGRERLAKLCLDHDIKPWWATRSRVRQPGS